MAEIITDMVTTPRWNVVLRGLDMADVMKLKGVLDIGLEDDEEPEEGESNVADALQKKLKDIINGHNPSTAGRRQGR